ncbi:TIGR04283 family arsenosugar biosynthesis glycosyltransferase [Psychrobacter sp. Cmf 22.2]|uniref:TIGR04283 family arsenosugar biosynthesis glycosyltransferase n=1 Tax=Psychrobacter sp. Cmf 22.2 TaxID=1926478 RepID=UPI0009469006|nr:TIGR04283 family arsenosugar biosynthesis glycosyltransferase [Psychrobacter sp. Cmf 22.2]OLF39263.1 glycosyl transferase [Psychrobacter sp. Cmf 22.2]
MPTISIIIPILNEADNLSRLFAHLTGLTPPPQQVILVDGGSIDGSFALAQYLIKDLRVVQQSAIDWQVLASSAGRALQMNRGATLATGDVLLFLHADTQLPNHAMTEIMSVVIRAEWGRFDVRLDSSECMLKLVSKMINWRSRLTGIATGDQAIFVKRDWFEQIGGYPNQALMEDVEISKRLKTIGKPACLTSQVITSARRWQQHGTWRTILLMWQLRFDYWRGVSADNIWQRYYR